MTTIYIASAVLIVIAIWAQADAHHARTALRNLRRNCFVTNEKGHRVRYRDASPERQRKAEQD